MDKKNVMSLSIYCYLSIYGNITQDIKKNEILPLERPQMGLEIIMLN